jgi:hypothetical protein
MLEIMMIDETNHGADVVDKIITCALRPVLHRFEEETAESFLGRFFVQQEGGFQFLSLVDGSGRASGNDPGQARGEIRLMVTRVEGEPSNFLIEAIYRGIREGTKFSGFELGGEIVFEADSVQVEADIFVVRYGVWEWQKCQ